VDVSGVICYIGSKKRKEQVVAGLFNSLRISIREKLNNCKRTVGSKRFREKTSTNEKEKKSEEHEDRTPYFISQQINLKRCNFRAGRALNHMSVLCVVHNFNILTITFCCNLILNAYRFGVLPIS
jgi:hypothetical protein